MGRRCVRTHNTRTRAVRSPCSAGVRGRGVCCCLGCVSARVCVCPPASPVNPIFSIRFGDFRLFRFHFSHRPISGLSLPRGRTDGQTPSRSCRAPQPPSAPPALKGTVPPPAKDPGVWPLRPVSALGQLPAGPDAGSPSRRGRGGQRPDAQVLRPWLAAPGVPSPGDKGPLSPAIVRGGEGRGLRCTMGDYPPRGGAHRTPEGPPPP